MRAIALQSEYCALNTIHFHLLMNVILTAYPLSHIVKDSRYERTGAHKNETGEIRAYSF